MNPRNKLILLGVLVGLLGIVAFFELGRSKPPRPAASASAPPAPARSQPASAPAREPQATPSAPAATTADSKPADAAQDPGLSAADLHELADWFDVLRPTGSVIARGSTPVFGIAVKTPVPPPAPAAQEPSAAPWMTEPGKLDGIIKVGQGPGKALFQGELYQVGDKVRGTDFTLTAVEDDFVTLKSDDRVIRRFWHD